VLFRSVVAVLIAIRWKWSKHLDVFGFAFFFALTGSLDLLVAKFTLQLIADYTTEDIGVRPPLLVVVVASIAMVLLHLGVFAATVVSTQYQQALLSIPLFLGSGAIMQVVLCGAFFHEFRDFSGMRVVSFSLSVVSMLVGMAVTSWANQPLPPANVPHRRVTPVITGGVLEMRVGNLSSTDLLMLSQIQRSAFVFGGKPNFNLTARLPYRKVATMPLLVSPVDQDQFYKLPARVQASTPLIHASHCMGKALLQG